MNVMKTLKTIGLSIVLGLFASLAQAEGGDKACANQVEVKVNGLVCDFCAQALEKVFGRQDAVAGIDVNLNEGRVVVDYKPEQSLDKETLTGLITDSGYNVVEILPAACEA